MTCDAKMRPFPSTMEVVCEQEGPHDRHRGVVRDMAYPGSQTAVEWMEADRRTFHGEWPGACDSQGCILPLGHHGRHAT